MPDVILTLTTPDGLNVRKFKPRFVQLPHAQIGEAAIISFDVDRDYDSYDDETAADNFLQAGTYGVLTRGSQTLWRGKSRAPTRESASGGPRELMCEGIDKLEELNYTFAGYDGERLFEVAAVEVEKTQITLVAGEATDEAAYPFYPVPAEPSCYMARGGSYGAAEATLATTINDSAASIVITATSASGMLPRGYWYIEGEVVFYDGLHGDPTNGNKLTARNCIRGALGTSAAAHTAPVTIYQHAALPITASGRVLVEGNAGGSWETIGGGHYDVNQSEGRFDFKANPLAAPFYAGAGYSAVRASYTLGNLSDASAPTLASVAQELLEFAGKGGPAIASGNIDVDVVRLPIKRLAVSQTRYTLDTLKQLIAELELEAFNTADAVGVWYDADNDKYCVKSLGQASTPDHVLHDFDVMSEEINTDGLRSAWLVGYQGAGPPIVSCSRIWHADRGDSWGGQTVEAYCYQYVDRELSNGWNFDESSNGNNLYTDLMTNGDSNSSGWGLKWPAAINANTPALYAYAPGAPDTCLVDHVRVVLDLRRFIKATECKIEVVGYTSYTIGDPPTAGGLIHLSDLLVFTLNEDTGPKASGPIERVGWLGGRFYDAIAPGKFGGRK